MTEHRYKPVKSCIYCGEKKLAADAPRFTDEHIIPYSLGGNLVLPESCCSACQRIINQQIETPITNLEWGYFRTKHNLPSRKKSVRSHVKLRRKDGSFFKMPIADYSAPLPLYRFYEARKLSGLPGCDDFHWTMSILTKKENEVAMQKKYPDWDQQHAILTRPHIFSRLLAKIAHCYIIAEYGIDGFKPLCTDLILGKTDNWCHLVGGEFDIPPPQPGKGHITDIYLKVASPHILIIVDIRLFASNETPKYHVVAGSIDTKNPVHRSKLETHQKEGKTKLIPFTGF
jgi:hypothetical protein